MTRCICASGAASLLAALVLAPTSAPGAVSIVNGGTLVTFDTLPAATDWSTAVTAGASADIITAAQMDTAVALLTAGGITGVLGNLGVSPPLATALGASYDPIGNVQTRPTGVKFTELMATLQNNTGGTLLNLALSYNFGVNATVAESPGLWGHRLYFSLTGAASSWTNATAFNLADSAPAQVVSGTLSLGSWTSGSTLYLLWADDNGPGAPDAGFTLDNVNFTPLGRSLIYNLAHTVGGAPNGTFTTAGGNYWLDSATPAAAAAIDIATFSQNPGSTATITVPIGGVTVGTMTVSNTSGTYTIGGAGAITTTLGLTKANAGTLVLTSANAFPSRTLTGGTVETQVTGALGTAGALVLSGAATLKTTTVAQTFGGQISTGTGGATVRTDTDFSATGLDGSGALTKSGAGTLTLTGSSGTATGGLLITGGKVSVATDTVLGANTQSFTLNGGTLEFTNTAPVTFIDATKAHTVNVSLVGGGLAVTDPVQANGVAITLAGKLVGGAGSTLTKTGAGTLRISAAQATLSSNWIVSGGSLEVAAVSALGAGTVTVNPAGVLVVAGGSALTSNSTITLSGGALGTRDGDLAVFSGPVTVAAASNLNLKSNTTPADSQSFTLTGKLSGSANLTLNGNDTAGNGGANGGGKFLALRNTFTDFSGTFNVLNAQILRSAPATTGNTLGSSVLNLTGGTLQVLDDGSGSGGFISYGSNVTVGTGGGTVDVDRAGAVNTANTILLGSLSIGAQTLTTTGANGYGVRFSAATLTGAATINATTATTTIGGAVGGGFALRKTGAGTLVLLGTSTYTGGTAIHGGIVSINDDAALGAAAGSVTIDTNATLQASGPVSTTRAFTLGTGGGQIDTNGQTVTLAAGSSVSGTALTKTGNGTLTLAGTQTYASLTTNGGATSVTNVNTALGTGTSTVTANARINFHASQKLASLTIANGVEVTFGDGLPFAGEGDKGVAFDGGTAAVPEPGAAGLLLTGALGFLSRRKRGAAAKSVRPA